MQLLYTSKQIIINYELWMKSLNILYYMYATLILSSVVMYVCVSNTTAEIIIICHLDQRNVWIIFPFIFQKYDIYIYHYMRILWFFFRRFKVISFALINSEHNRWLQLLVSDSLKIERYENPAWDHVHRDVMRTVPIIDL